MQNPRANKDERPRLAHPNTSANVPLPYDVWHEVLKYFRYDVTTDSDNELCKRRMDVLSIALLSRSLTSIALDVLWMGMNSLLPVIDVVNSFASSQEDVFFEFVDDSGGRGTKWSWRLQRPIDVLVCSRAQEYLSRVQTFHITGQWNTKETSVWPVIERCFGRTCLSSLRRLELSLENGDFLPAVGLVPLLSPAMTTLVINEMFGSGSAQTLLKLVKSHGCELKEITYFGRNTPDLLLDFVYFKDLKRLDIGHGDDHLVERGSIVPVSRVLKQLPSLTILWIDLRIFPRLGERSLSPVHHPSLESLELTGDADDLQDFLLDQLRSSSLHTLSVKVVGAHGNAWNIICSRAASSFPSLRSLTLRHRRRGTFAHGRPLLYRDIHPILLSRQLTKLYLDDIAHQLTTRDLLAMLKTLPNLQTLKVLSYPSYQDGPGFGASVLVPISQQAHLRSLSIRLDFSNFLTPLPSSVGRLSRSRLGEIYLGTFGGPVFELEERAVLAQNILTLFPRLMTFTFQPDRVVDLEMLIAEFKGRVLNCYLGT